MKTKQFWGILLLSLCDILLASCRDDDSEDVSRVVIMQVSETTVWEPVWGSDVLSEHMLVKEENCAEWQKLVMGGIMGFEYEHGHGYELKVRKTILANPPQDGSNCIYQLIEIITDIMPEPPVLEEWPEEAKFKLEMSQLKTFMDLDTPVAAPFDFLAFKILDNNNGYSFPEVPEYVHYYDSIVAASPVMPDTYRLYEKYTYGTALIEHIASLWGSYFFEKGDFQLVFKGYKDGEVKYEYQINQTMRERDFLGIDWEKCGFVLANPKTSCIYCLLDTRYKFLLSDTQMRNGTCYVELKVAGVPDFADAESLRTELDGLRWLLKKHLGEKSATGAADFKTIENAEIVETYENKTTRVALLHFLGDENHGEHYSAVAEPK